MSVTIEAGEPRDASEPAVPTPGAAPPPGADPLPADLTCSARGCRNPATFDLRWNNPKIHTPDRRKHWLACGEHRDSLSAFLSARGFLRETVPLDAS